MNSQLIQLILLAICMIALLAFIFWSFDKYIEAKKSNKMSTKIVFIPVIDTFLLGIFLIIMGNVKLQDTNSLTVFTWSSVALTMKCCGYLVILYELISMIQPLINKFKEQISFGWWIAINVAKKIITIFIIFKIITLIF